MTEGEAGSSVPGRLRLCSCTPRLQLFRSPRYLLLVSVPLRGRHVFPVTQLPSQLLLSLGAEPWALWEDTGSSRLSFPFTCTCVPMTLRLIQWNEPAGTEASIRSCRSLLFFIGGSYRTDNMHTRYTQSMVSCSFSLTGLVALRLGLAPHQISRKRN